MSSLRNLALLALLISSHLSSAQQTKATQQITISRETTFLTEPVGQDGRIDYVEAINIRDSQGVTPENNAVVLIWQTLGTSREMRPEIQDEFFRRLGIPVPPENGDYLPSSYEMMKLAAEAQLKAAEESCGAQLKAMAGPADPPNRLQVAIAKVEQQINKPWSEKELPQAADWFDKHNHLIDQLAAAANRSRFFAPAISTTRHARTISILLPTAQISREVARILSYRAMLRLGRNQTDAALADLLAMRKLARLLATERSYLIQMLVGYAIEGIAISKEPYFLTPGRLTEDQLQKALADRLALPEFPSVASSVDYYERFAALDVAMDLGWLNFGEQDPLSGMDFTFVDSPTPTWQRKLFQIIFNESVDLNEALRSINREYDQLVAALSGPTIHERREKLTAIEDSIKQRHAEMLGGDLGPSLLVMKFLALNPQDRGEQLGEIVLHFIMPAVFQVSRAEAQSQARIRLSQLAVAIALYESRNKSLPPSLNDLRTSGILKQLPLDPFSNQSFIFHEIPGGWSLSSVGANGTDDSANFDPKSPGKIDDVVFRSPLP